MKSSTFELGLTVAFQKDHGLSDQKAFSLELYLKKRKGDNYLREGV